MDFRQATAQEVDADDAAIVVAQALVRYHVGFWFVTDGNTVFVKTYKDRINDEEVIVTLENIDEIMRHRLAIQSGKVTSL